MRGHRERILTPEGDAHKFTEACFALSGGTRVEVLRVLLLSREPLHIREIARRVKLDASPVRTHLEVLMKTGLVRELPEPGRERRFVADVSGVRLILTPPERPVDAPADKPPSRAILRIGEKMRHIEERVHKMERELAELSDERARLWRELE